MNNTAVIKKANRRLDLAVQIACTIKELPLRTDFHRWARAALDGGGQITLRLVDANEGRELNHAYRHKNYATNVLSFPYETEPRLVGDLVICPEVVAREAVEQGKSLNAHYAHLLVHGMLHLQGYDHETGEEEAMVMENAERKILAILGYPDPYSEI